MVVRLAFENIRKGNRGPLRISLLGGDAALTTRASTHARDDVIGKEIHVLDDLPVRHVSGRAEEDEMVGAHCLAPFLEQLDDLIGRADRNEERIR